MFRPRIARFAPTLGIAALLVSPLACKKGEGEDEAGKAEAGKEASADGDAKTAEGGDSKSAEGGDTKPAEGGDTKPTQGGSDASAVGGRIDRGNAIGHFVLPNASKLLEKIRDQAAPPSAKGYLNEAALRALASMPLGPRSGIAQHVSLSAPMGCVLIDDTATEAPVACVVGYEGGAAAAVSDVGKDGKLPDAGSHTAHYRMGSDDIYIDALGDAVVISTHDAVFDKAKGYLQANMLDRAGSITDDVEVVVYPKAAMTRYSAEVEKLLSAARGAPAPVTGNPIVDSLAEYQRTSMDKGFDYYREIDQFDFGFGLDEIGAIIRFAVHPTPGSSTESDAAAIASGPLDTTLVTQLPAETWMAMAWAVDWKAAWSAEAAAAPRDALIDAYAQGTGQNADDVRKTVTTFFEENAELYGKNIAAGVVHLPGTVGGMVISRKVDKPAREAWKTWSEGFSPESVLGPMGTQFVTWSFSYDDHQVGGVGVDRWTIEPGPEARKQIAASSDPELKAIEKALGGWKLVVDRVELGDRALFVVAPAAEDKYVEAAIAATKGGPSTGADAGLKMLLSRNPGTSGLWAVDVDGAMTWAREVLPAEATRKLPPGMGANLGDFYVSATYSNIGSQTGEMVLSQNLIDGLRKLAD